MSRHFLRALPRLIVTLCLAPVLALATTVRFETNMGPIDLELYDTQAPLTVANLLAYVRGGDYSNMYFHRLVRNFVLQGGGYRYPVTKITSRGNVQNEFSAQRPNVRGTVAMAKLPGLPNSATSEWFVNLADNPSLNTQNEGFTVFGRVTPATLPTVDAMAALTIVNANGCCLSALGELPVRSIPSSGLLTEANLIHVREARELPTTTASDADRVMNYLEALFPQFIPTRGSFGGTNLGYYFRHYPDSSSFVGTKDGGVYFLVPSFSPDVGYLGTVADWLAAAKLAGY